ncbi:DUF952 domain-containing protein [Nostocales cyanobacterium LEGE 11386]|nr:DUF952 domain-containing protein [Nostocales cyanobacterium LEGE 11386]
MILHIVDNSTWHKAKQQNKYAPASLQEEGFIHCSTLDTVIEVANYLFRGQHGLLLLSIELAKVKANVLFEQVGNQQRWVFPHIYGELNIDAVVQEIPFEPESNGCFRLPEALQIK